MSKDPTKLDISALSGNDLFEALASGKPITVRAPTKADKLNALLTTRVAPFIEHWQDVSVVLMVHVQRCACGSSFESPNAIRFVKRKHKKTGALHWRRFDDFAFCELQYRKDLPAEIAYREEQVGACQRCWGLTHLLQGQAIQHTHDVPVLEEPMQPQYISTASLDRAPSENIIALRTSTQPEPADEVEEVGDDWQQIS